MIVNGEMDSTATKLKQKLLGITVILVLLNSVFYSLLGKLVFQLKRSNRQPVDKNAHIQCQLNFIAAVTQLPGDAEDVLLKQLSGFLIVWCWAAIKESDGIRAMLHPLAQDINDTSPGGFSL